VRSSIIAIDGDITIGRECLVRAPCRTIDGDIEIGRGARIRTLQSVSGRIELFGDVEVRGNLQTVDGEIICRQGVRVDGDINTVDGEIRLARTRVTEDVTTFDADILLDDRSVVEHDIIVRRVTSEGDDYQRRRLRIDLRGGSVVEGNVEVLDEDVIVTVHLYDGSRVRGRIRGAEVVEH
jgi:DUF4097 and DUF4098 domain-containing protein YvlB